MANNTLSISIEQALAMIGSDMQKVYSKLDITPLKVTAYSGPFEALITTTGDVYDYDAASTETPDGVTVLDATGKGSGRWIKRDIAVSGDFTGLISNYDPGNIAQVFTSTTNF